MLQKIGRECRVTLADRSSDTVMRKYIYIFVHTVYMHIVMRCVCVFEKYIRSLNY